MYHFGLVQFIALQMLPFQKIVKRPDDEHIQDDTDLLKHQVKLTHCCDEMDDCEDMVLHCYLHGEKNTPTVADEHALRKRIVDFAVDRSDAESRAWNRQRTQFGGGWGHITRRFMMSSMV